MVSRIALAATLVLGGLAVAQPAPPASRPGDGKLPHVQVDVKARTVRVECEQINAQMPLEFFCCAVNSNEHEAVMRTAAKASHIHFALTMLNVEPGQPVHYNKATDKWIPPSGPPLHIFVEWEKDAKQFRVPAYRMMRNLKTKKEAPPFMWVFTGSRILEDKSYAADVTGYIVSVVNFDLTLIDIPDLASDANETLEWEINPDVVPPKGTKVWMVIEPTGKAPAPKVDPPKGDQPKVDAPKGDPPKGGADAAPGDGFAKLSDVTIDEAKVKALRETWEKAIRPHRKELSTAADTHYRVIASLRREQQRLIDESDRIQRVIDQLQKEYQDLTTPRPENE